MVCVATLLELEATLELLDALELAGALELLAAVALYTSISAMRSGELPLTTRLIFFMDTAPRLTVRAAPIPVPVANTAPVSLFTNCQAQDHRIKINSTTPLYRNPLVGCATGLGIGAGIAVAYQFGVVKPRAIGTGTGAGERQVVAQGLRVHSHGQATGNAEQ